MIEIGGKFNIEIYYNRKTIDTEKLSGLLLVARLSKLTLLEIH